MSNDDNEPEYPESEKLAKGRRDRQTIHDFFDFLGDRGLMLGETRDYDEYSSPQFVPTGRTVDSLVMDYLGVDQIKLEEERRAMLAAMRKLQETTDPIRRPRQS